MSRVELPGRASFWTVRWLGELGVNGLTTNPEGSVTVNLVSFCAGRRCPVLSNYTQDTLSLQTGRFLVAEIFSLALS